MSAGLPTDIEFVVHELVSETVNISVSWAKSESVVAVSVMESDAPESE